jgi:hypothetical protein
MLLDMMFFFPIASSGVGIHILHVYLGTLLASCEGVYMIGLRCNVRMLRITYREACHYCLKLGERRKMNESI